MAAPFPQNPFGKTTGPQAHPFHERVATMGKTAWRWFYGYGYFADRGCPQPAVP